MATQVAKKRFQPNVPVKAGVLYKAVVNGKDYTVRAKYNKTLSEFNAMWFENIYPKQYFFRGSEFNSFNGVLMPSDEIIVDGVSYLNEQAGALSNEELNVLFDTYKEGRLVAGLLLTGTEDHRTHKINIRPFQNKNSEEIKYFGMNDFTRTVGVNVLNIVKAQEVVFEVTETFIPVRAISVIVHKVVVSFANYTATYQGTSPTSTTSTSATYNIPNSLTSRRLTITPNGGALILNFV